MADEQAKPTDASTASVQWLDNIKQLIDQYKLPGIDFAALAEWQRKDVEALIEANRQANEGFRALIEKRNEILRESFQEWQAAMKGLTGADALSKQTDVAKSGFDKAVANFRELSQLETEAWTNTWKTVQDRMQDNLANLQKLLRPK
ncbi:MAG: phasin family protein [Planctomycetales bacterium]|nr:phasin family protein [Planctomycetales bacterium]